MSSESERQRDKARIDRLLDAWDAVLVAEGDDPSVETLTLASRSLPALLERRSKLLGLDAQPGATEQQGEKPMDRIMRVVPGGSNAAVVLGPTPAVKHLPKQEPK